MGRKDKEIRNLGEIHDIIKEGIFCHIAMSRNNIPYIVSMNFGFHEECIYLHSANEGFKIDILKANPFVCIEVVQDVRLVKSLDVCKTSMNYRSVIVFGKVEFLTDEREKKKALGFIVKHYNKDIREDELEFSGDILNKLIIMKVKIDKMTGKKSV